MRRFVFRLASVERWRFVAKREARAVFALAVAEASARRDERARAADALLDAASVDSPALRAGDPRALRELAAWRDGLRHTEALAAERAVKAAAAAASAERDLTQAARAHRVLELLRERKRQRWLDDSAREEQQLLDEAHRLRIGRDPALGEEAGS